MCSALHTHPQAFSKCRAHQRAHRCIWRQLCACALSNRAGRPLDQGLSSLYRQRHRRVTACNALHSRLSAHHQIAHVLIHSRTVLTCLITHELHSTCERCNKCTASRRHGRHAIRGGRSLLSPALRKRACTLHAGRHSALRRHHWRGSHFLALWQRTDTALWGSQLCLQQSKNFRRCFHGGFFTNQLCQLLHTCINRTHVTAQGVHQDFRILRRASHLRHVTLGLLRHLFGHFIFKPSHDSAVT